MAKDSHHPALSNYGNIIELQNLSQVDDIYLVPKALLIVLQDDQNTNDVWPSALGTTEKSYNEHTLRPMRFFDPKALSLSQFTLLTPILSHSSFTH